MHITPIRALLLIVLAGFLLRISMINYSLPDAERIQLHFSNQPPSTVKPENLNVFRVLNSFYSDEADIIGAISNMKPQNFDFNPREHYWGHTQFYAITAAYGAAFILRYIPLKPNKYFYFEHPEEMAKLYRIGRLLTLLMATASMIMIFLLVKNLWGERAGLIAALLLAVMPLHVLLSNIMAFDVPMHFWALVTIFFLVRYLDKGERKILWATAIAFGLAMGTKYHGVFLGFPILYVFKQRDKRWFSPACLRCLAIAFVTFMLTNPYLFLDWRTVYEQGFHRSILTRHVEKLPTTAVLGNMLEIIIFRSPRKLMACWGIVSALLLLVFAGFGLMRDKKRGPIFFMLTLPAFLGDALFQASVLRYFLLTSVFLIPLAAFGFHEAAKRHTWMWIFLILAAGNCIWLDLQMIAMSKDPYAEHVTAKWIMQNVPKGSSIGVYHRMYFSPPIDWDAYDVQGFMQNRTERIHPEYFVLPDFDEHAWIRKELGSDYQEIARVGRYPDVANAPGWRRPNEYEMGEFQGFQTPYLILSRVKQ